MPDDPGSQDLSRRFDAAVSGTELSDLRRLASDLDLFGRQPPSMGGPRPRLRVTPRAEPATFRLRVDLDGARPPIWRRLEVRSDATLDVVHQVLQSAFGWSDSHLHRFALGGDPFDAHSELFLCPFDVEEGEDDGTPAGEVRIDETVAEPGDVLRYVYDYGDSWDLVITLEEVRDQTVGAPVASCLDGRRAAPPEDCGGLRDAEGLADVLDDPAYFDPAEVNEALRDPFVSLREQGLHPGLVGILTALRGTATGDDLVLRVLSIPESAALSDDELTANLCAHIWFLDRASGDGIELTDAGYLKPADVEEASALLPSMGDWIGKNNREYHTLPLLDFRQSLQRMGLLRKRKNRLLLTRAGDAARRDPAVLWRHLAVHLGIDKDGTCAEQARLLVLLHIASDPKGEHRHGVAQALTELGWRRADRRPFSPEDVRWIEGEIHDLLANVTDRPQRFGDRHPSAAAVALVRAALTPGR